MADDGEAVKKLNENLMKKLNVQMVDLMCQYSKIKNEIKLIPEMLNLLGCNKENFIKLLKNMNYQTFEKENNLYFKYIPSRRPVKRKKFKNEIKDNPFQVLKKLNLK